MGGPARERASFGEAAEAAEFVRMLDRFERGEISSDAFRAFRLTRGIYGQRQDGVQMVRAKIPQGVLSAAQLRVLADVSERWSRGFGHLTTRQNLQFHFVRTADVAPMMEAINACGLTTREACSHAVRNVTACPYAGVCPGEAFDVTTYGEQITRFFLRGPLGSGLPRKFKIGLSGCADDCAQGAINDIGIVAKVEGGKRGFRITAGGGLSTLPRAGGTLAEFLPAGDLIPACEAVVRVFAAEGNRRNLHKARLKWAIERLGWDRFAALWREAFATARATRDNLPPPLGVEETEPRRERPAPLATIPPAGSFARWRATNVRAQRQPGQFAATAWLRLGDVSGRQLRTAADLALRFGEGSVRTTNQQNLVFRWIREGDLPALWRRLDEAGLGAPDAASVADVVSCPGAETCRIAVTTSRGLAQLLGDTLRAAGAASGSGASTDIKVSGCPNGCGQHHVAAIGLQGGVRRLGDRLVPQYLLTIGGGIDEQGARFGRLVAKIPARRVPEAVERLLALYDAQRRPGQTPRDFFGRLPVETARARLADLAEMTERSARPEDFIDLGASVAFEVVTLDGECAA